MRIKATSLIVAIVFCCSALACSVEELRDLRRAELCYEYCGLDVEIYKGPIPASDKRLEFLVSNKLDFYSESKALLSDCKAVESSVKTRDIDRMKQSFEKLASGLAQLSYDKDSKLGAQYELQKWIVQTEYMLARVLDADRELCVSPTAIKRLLPDCLFETNMKIRWSYMFRLKAFRDLLIVKAAMNAYQKKNAALPENLDALSDYLKGVLGISVRDIVYERKDDIWQLVICEDKTILKKRAFNVYVPVIGGSSAHVSSERSRIVLSSDFNAKRRALFSGELLNAGTLLACKLENGRIVQPRED